MSNAGETADNGDYYEYTTSDGVPNFKHETNEVYIYRFPGNFWCINPTLDAEPGFGIHYWKSAMSDTPYIGAYDDGGIGTAPSGIVAAG